MTRPTRIATSGLLSQAVTFLANILQDTERKLEAATSFEREYFWTTAQYSVLNDETKKRVVFTSPFGTGKTILLKAKARKLLAKNKKVVLVIFNDPTLPTDSMLTFTYRSEFENLSNASVMAIKSGKMV